MEKLRSQNAFLPLGRMKTKGKEVVRMPKTQEGEEHMVEVQNEKNLEEDTSRHEAEGKNVSSQAKISYKEKASLKQVGDSKDWISNDDEPKESDDAMLKSTQTFT
nr:hypothetical protein Itr_chr11CG20230 [Ipomoea trifida]